MNEPLEREVAVLNAALELSPAERAAYLDRACEAGVKSKETVSQITQTVPLVHEAWLRLTVPHTFAP